MAKQEQQEFDFEKKDIAMPGLTDEDRENPEILEAYYTIFGTVNDC